MSAAVLSGLEGGGAIRIGRMIGSPVVPHTKHSTPSARASLNPEHYSLRSRSPYCGVRPGCAAGIPEDFNHAFGASRRDSRHTFEPAMLDLEMSARRQLTVQLTIVTAGGPLPLQITLPTEALLATRGSRANPHSIFKWPHHSRLLVTLLATFAW